MQAADNKDANEFSNSVGKIAKRKLKALKNDKKGVWFGLGMMGIVGWTIAVPTLLGAAFGVWLDKKYPETFSWTLSCLIIGLFVGCIIAWRWINKEHNEINRNNDDTN